MLGSIKGVCMTPGLFDTEGWTQGFMHVSQALYTPSPYISFFLLGGVGDDFWDKVSLCRSFWVSWNLLCRQNLKDLRASTSWVMGLNDYATTPSNPFIFFAFRKGLALYSVAQARLDLLLFLSLFPKDLGLGLWQSRLRCVGFTDTVMTSAPQTALSLGGSDHKG